MFSWLQRFNKIKITPHKLSIKTNYTYDSWNKITNGQVKTCVYHDNIFIGFVDFRSFTGQIGLIEVNKKYRRQGIAKFLLNHVEDELLKNSLTNVWVVCSKNHYFWSKQKNYIFTVCLKHHTY
jgi:ribosomal protein S18 acetylase RimI-like enzyme